MKRYVGARYVPKFMGQYNETTKYEALSVVDNGEGTSYISNKPTPAGTPLNNTEYWTVYGSTNGAIVDIQERLSKIEMVVKTPFMYGGVGDGLTDDTVAIQACIGNGSVIDLCGKTWRITDCLNFDRKSFIEIKNGKIIHDAGTTHNTIYGHDCYCIYVHDIEFNANGNDPNATYVWPDNNQAAVLLGRSSRVVVERNKFSNYYYGVCILTAAEHMSTNSDSMRSYNGAVNQNYFENCGSCIDLYGKTLDIGFNTFDSITPRFPLVQIEPVGAAIDPSNPIDEDYDSSGFNVNIHDNYFLNITTERCIKIHNHAAATKINNNLFINFYYAIDIDNAVANEISDNIFMHQVKATLDAGTPNPRSNPPQCIYAREGDIKNNSFYDINSGVYVAGNYSQDYSVRVTDNYFDGVHVSAILEYIDGTIDSDVAKLYCKGNIIKNVPDHDDADLDYFIRAISIERGTAIIKDNIIETEGKAIRSYSNAYSLIQNTLCSNPPTETIAPMTGFTNFNNLP